MPRRTVALFAMLLATTTLYGGDPWKDKPYKQWDEKDVRRVLMDSPWAKEVRVDGSWRGAGVSTPGTSDTAGTGTGGYGQSTAGGVALSGPQGVGRGGESEQSGGNPPTVYLVRWVSSRSTRQAMARAAELRGTAEADAEQILAQDLPEYVLLVLGRDITLFAQAGEKALRGKSYLLAKKTKTHLMPVRVELQYPQSASDQPKAATGRGVSGVVFYFSKKTAGGEPALAPDEKSVEFVCDAGGLHLKTGFDLQKMAGPQGLDW
ncbi:MAG TPA: hypothetical protein VKE24_02870 [Candidatus Acidoferrales bacterium]|nr:hypothetical protein [Candidatus Acidoferrales bacterium]